MKKQFFLLLLLVGVLIFTATRMVKSNNGSVAEVPDEIKQQEISQFLEQLTSALKSGEKARFNSYWVSQPPQNAVPVDRFKLRELQRSPERFDAWNITVIPDKVKRYCVTTPYPGQLDTCTLYLLETPQGLRVEKMTGLARL